MTLPEPLTMRIYYAKHPSGTGDFIAVKHGATGYYKTTVYTQEHAETLNERQGIKPAEVKAAVTCSMFDCWQNFDKLTAENWNP